MDLYTADINILELDLEAFFPRCIKPKSIRLMYVPVPNHTYGSRYLGLNLQALRPLRGTIQLFVMD